jgi:hypothetical protein
VHGRDTCCAPSEEESFVRDLRYPIQVLVLIYDVRSLLANYSSILVDLLFLTKLYARFVCLLFSLV